MEFKPEIMLSHNLLTLIFGLTAIFVLTKLYLKYRYRYILIYIINVIAFNVLALLNLPLNYLLSIYEIFVESIIKLLSIYCFFVFILAVEYFWAYTYTLFVSQLMNKKVTRKIKIGYIIVFLISLIIFTPAFITDSGKDFVAHPGMYENVGNITLVLQYIIYFAKLIVFGILLYFLYYSKKYFRKTESKAIGIYGYPIAVIWSIIFLGIVLESFIYIGYNISLLITASSIIYNLASAIAFFFITKNFSGTEEAGTNSTIDIESQFEKYGISKREQEIVLLICEGKSNQEIADELFISLSTVKDHINNLFQKTHVKNRVQLTNLFK